MLSNKKLKERDHMEVIKIEGRIYRVFHDLWTLLQEVIS